MFEDNPLLLLFVIMLLGLVLCSFLGGSRCSNEGFDTNSSSSGSKSKNTSFSSSSSSSSGSSSGSNYDNYNHYTGESFPSVFYNSEGGSAEIIQRDSGNIISVTNSDGERSLFKVPSEGSKEMYDGPNGTQVTVITTDKSKNGSRAQIVTTTDGYVAIRVLDSNDDITEYIGTPANESVDDMTSSPMNDGHTIFSNSDSISRGGNNDSYENSSVNNSINNTDGAYDAYLPPGIPKSEIAPGDEGLYILKSQVVPPVCPACPAYGPTALLSQKNSATDSETTDSETTDPNKCPPCPACERCPEPSFACKLVPNYGSSNNSMIPVPVLSAFSTFGM
jgi:hypothetical protein